MGKLRQKLAAADVAASTAAPTTAPTKGVKSASAKASQVAAPGKPIDSRFAHMLKDPRFRRPPKKEFKVKVDERFKRMFDDEAFDASKGAPWLHFSFLFCHV